MKLTINSEFHNLIPPISEEEYQLLEESLLNEGCREAIVTWNDTILDGHNRYEICKRHGIGFKCLEKEFKDEDEAKVWVIRNQLARRNLTSEQISYLRGIRYNLEKKQHGGDRKSSGQNDHLISEAEKHDRIWHTPGKSFAERMAEEHGVSEKTIRRDAEFAEAVDQLPDEEKKEVLSGKSKRTKKEIKQAARKGEMSVNRAYREAEKKKQKLKEREEKKKQKFINLKTKKLEKSKTLGKLRYYWSIADAEEKKEFKKYIKREGN